MEFEQVLVDAIRHYSLPALVGALATFCVAALLAHVHLRTRGLIELHRRVCALRARHEARTDPMSVLRLRKFRKLESHLRELLR